MKSLYHSEQGERFEAARSHNADTLGKIWNAEIHERSKTFLWRILSNALPIRKVLALRFQILDKSCLQCCMGEESQEHVFLECPYARAVRFQTWGFKTNQFLSLSVEQWIERILDKSIIVFQDDGDRNLLAAVYTMEDIWHARNSKLNNNINQVIPRRAATINSKVQEFISYIANHTTVTRGTIPAGQSNYQSDYIGINFDAAIRTEFVAGGCTFRDQ